MKRRLITPILFLLFITGFSQNVSYEVHGKYKHPVKVETLTKAVSISDIIPYYPVNWISGYVSTELSVTGDGKEKIASGQDDLLSAEQKRILKKVDPGTEIVIKIIYNYNNPVNGNIETGNMNYSATVVPETEAGYTGGHEQMTQYLKENAMDKIPDSAFKQLQPVVVRFTVNEEGEIANAEISRESGDPQIDRLLLDVINNMPKWSPAQDSGGKRVRQEFEFSVSSGGGC
jgi:TonB family protein